MGNWHAVPTKTFVELGGDRETCPSKQSREVIVNEAITEHRTLEFADRLGVWSRVRRYLPSVLFPVVFHKILIVKGKNTCNRIDIWSCRAPP